MAYALVQQSQNSAGGTSVTSLASTAFGSNPTAGNFFWYVICYTATSEQTATFSDTLGNTPVELGHFFNATGQIGLRWGYVKNILGGSADTPAVTYGGSVTFPGIYIAEYSGLDTSAPFTTGEFSTNFQPALGVGTNNITSGNTPTLSRQPVLQVGFCFDNTNPTDQTAGGAFSGHTGVWFFGGSNGAYSGLPEDRRLTATAPVAALFNAIAGTDDYFTITAVFAEAGAGAGVAPAARSTPPGPGVSPSKLNQFVTPPRGYVVPVSVLGTASGGSIASASGSLSSLQTSGGLGFIPQPGPGAQGPFNNNQFLSSPRAAITAAPQFFMAGVGGSIASGSATLAQLQAWGGIGTSIASAVATLTTLATSGGSTGYLTQPGPGVGPFSNNQFQTPPRSTNVQFQALVGAAAASAISSGAASLATGVIVTASARGLATAAASLGTGNNMTAGARAAATASGALTAAAQMNAAASSIASSSPALLTGITLAANVTGLSYASAAIGSGTALTITAAGLAYAAGTLLTQTLISAAPTGFGSASAQLGTGSQLAAAGFSTANASGGLSTSIQLSAQAMGLASASPILTGSVIVSASATGFASAQGTLTTGTMLSASGSATGSANAALATAVAPYSAFAFGSASASANLNGNVVLVASGGSNSQVTARLLTVLQPPGEFADIRWLRAPRGAGVAYAEFFQGVSEQLWYGVNWEDWLASNWEANSSAALNQALRPTIPNGLEFVCTQAGQTGAVEPLWPTFAGGVVVDGTTMWQGQAISSVSLDDTISGSSFSAPVGIVLDSGQVLTQRSYLIIDSTTSVVGTDYDVLCTIFTTGGQQKIAKLRIKVR